jgi:flagellar biosynthesis protein FliQ
MSEGIVQLLGGLLLSALPLLIASFVVGSIIAALRAVGSGG